MTTKLETPAKQDFLEEVSEWIEAFDDVIATDWEQGAELLAALKQRAREAGVPTPSELITPYRNTIPQHDEVAYPGDRSLERRVEALIRWNAMAMVHRQNKDRKSVV
jgi:pyruvate dehydrogenase E1 component